MHRYRLRKSRNPRPDGTGFGNLGFYNRIAGAACCVANPGSDVAHALVLAASRLLSTPLRR
jgi:hypothetical protein